MQNAKFDLKVIYEDSNFLVIDKPAGIVVFSEGKTNEEALIDLVLKERPELKNVGKSPRYGIIHRLDKDTSGILLVAKNNETFDFLQKQFKKREVEKKYLALVCGNVKNDQGLIETLIGRSPKDRKKQKVFMPSEPGAEEKRKAITEYKVLQRLEKYTLLEAVPKTGRKHQIRCHLSYIQHPIAADKMYGFKNQPCPKELTRHFLHASYLKIQLPDGKTKEFTSELPDDLQKILNNIKIKN